MRVLLLSVAVLVLWPLSAYAESLVSPNFRVDESFVGGSGDVQSSSPNFKSDSAAGEIGVGNSSSPNLQTQPGYVTTSDPALTLSVSGTTINFGALSTSATATGTSTFSVINYTSYGYVVQVVGTPPKTGNYALAGMSGGLSQTGIEQFGINLVHNTSPINFGADPAAGTTAPHYGVAASGYNSADHYRYTNGDTIASAPKSSGQTNFTIAYIANASTTTAGGSYSGSLTLVCTGTY